jgi:NAD(P)-dependent dehydrogenase (short-subunit alcohol dehydrogenase family)
MVEKVCIVTGASRGLGKAVAGALARQGATVIMACREKSGGESARADILTKSPNQNVEVMSLDLSDQVSIRKFVQNVKGKYDRLDVLIHAAAVYKAQRIVTQDGLETMFATNHLGPFLLTSLLLDKLKEAAPDHAP